MKKSILIALFIMFLVVGWIGSGQLSNFKNQDETNTVSTSKKSGKNVIVEEIEDKGKRVEIKEFKFSQIDQSIELQGQTTHNKRIDVKSETSGNIVSINFSRGDKVTKGMPLIEISKENRIELLNSAKELIKLYEIEYSSAKQLIDKGLSSKSKLGLASYNLANAKSQLKNIELDIKKTYITSPFSGVISNKMVEESEYISLGNSLFTIIDLNPIKIQAYLSEFEVNKVSLGTKAVIENTNGIKKIGKISFVSPSAEISTRTFEITIEADNADLLFKSGITTKITIAGSELKAHKIPPSILTLKDDGTVGVKAINDKNIVVFYPTTSVKDTIDGIWVSGLPDIVNLIITGQEYISVGESVSN